MDFIDNSYLLIIAGLITIAYFSIKVFKFGRRLLNEAPWSETFNFKKFGDWAVVTGASDGIGKALSQELAKYGLNLVLIARTRGKLEKFGKELSEKYGIEIKCIVIDFTHDESIYDIIKEEMKDLNVALLINNVGTMKQGMSLLDTPDLTKFSTDLCRVNVVAMTKMTELVLPKMVQKRGGVITNVSSVVGSKVVPFMSLYSASKHAINCFTTALRHEYKNSGVIFQTLSPGMTSTPMTEVEPGLFVPTAEIFGRYAIKALGKSDYTNSSLFVHNLNEFLTWLMPEWVFGLVGKSLKIP